MGMRKLFICIFLIFLSGCFNSGKEKSTNSDDFIRKIVDTRIMISETEAYVRNFIINNSLSYCSDFEESFKISNSLSESEDIQEKIGVIKTQFSKSDIQFREASDQLEKETGKYFIKKIKLYDSIKYLEEISQDHKNSIRELHRIKKSIVKDVKTIFPILQGLSHKASLVNSFNEMEKSLIKINELEKSLSLAIKEKKCSFQIQAKETLIEIEQKHTVLRNAIFLRIELAKEKGELVFISAQSYLEAQYYNFNKKSDHTTKIDNNFTKCGAKR